MHICMLCCLVDVDYTQAEEGVCLVCGRRDKVICVEFYHFKFEDKNYCEIGGEG